jgi:hypothetical protein
MVRRMSRSRQLEPGVGGAGEYLAGLAGDVPVADEHVVRADLGDRFGLVGVPGGGRPPGNVTMYEVLASHFPTGLLSCAGRRYLNST